MKSMIRMFILAGTLSLTTQSFAEPNARAGLFGGGHLGGPELESGPAAMGSLGFIVGPNLALDLQGSWMRADSDVLVLGEPAFRATVTSVEFVPKITYDLGGIHPYLQAGVGYFLIGEDESDELKSAIRSLPPPTIYRYDIKDTVGGIFGAGFDIPLSKTVAFSIDAAYIRLRPKESGYFSTGGVLLAETSERVNLDTWRLLGGLRVRFGGNPHEMNVY